MNQIALPPPGGITEGDIGALLARTRRSRRFSQMDLALEAGISPRHLSFVETGRATPSSSPPASPRRIARRRSNRRR